MASPRSRHHADVARTIHSTPLFRFPEPAHREPTRAASGPCCKTARRSAGRPKRQARSSPATNPLSLPAEPRKACATEPGVHTSFRCPYGLETSGQSRFAHRPAQSAVSPCFLRSRPLDTALETWPSGRRHTPAKGADGKPSRGFESLRLRHPHIFLMFSEKSLCYHCLAHWHGH